MSSATHANSSDPAPQLIRDRRITDVRPLLSPALLSEELPLDNAAAHTVVHGRRAVTNILDSRDDRLLLFVGPCSVHDPAAALEYAGRLAELAAEVDEAIQIVMRVYFEKPRTTLGWKGLINDPNLDGTHNVNAGLRTARKVLLDVLSTGLPTAAEFLDPITPQYIADTVSWGAIGARTSESQVHRNLASGLSMPIGFKNSTSGEVQGAVDAVRAAASSHVFPGVTPDGLGAILTTAGNPDCHVILRGGGSGTNYDAANVHDVLSRLRAADLPERVVIDASHGNSGKDHRRQPGVIADVAGRVADGETGVVGLMAESFLAEGRQDLALGQSKALRYGQSITDACLGWEQTVSVVGELAEAVDKRRSR